MYRPVDSRSIAASISRSGAGAPAERVATAALILLVALTPLLRGLETILLPEGQATAVARLHIATLELLFIGAVACCPRVALPTVNDLPRPAFWLLVIWLGWSGLAVMAAEAPAVALLRQTEWLLHGLAAAAFYAGLGAMPQWRDMVLRALFLGFLLYAVGITFLLLSIPEESDFPWLGAMLGFRNIRHFSEYAAVAVLAGLAPLLAAGWPSKAALGGRVLTLVVAWGYLFWSGGRAAVLALAVMLGLALFLRLIARPLDFCKLAGATALAGLLLSIPLTPPHGSFGVLRIAEDAVPVDGIAHYGSGRAEMWRQAAEMVAAHPLLGLGPDNYAMTQEKQEFWGFEHPHNLLLQASLDWGVPGALFFLVGLAYLFFRAGRHVRHAREPAARVGFLIAGTLLIAAFFAGPLYYGFSTMLAGFGLAAALPPMTGPARPHRPGRVLAALSPPALLMLVFGLTVATLAAPRTPAMTGWQTRLLTLFPAAMEMEDAGEKVDGWATDWRRQGHAGTGQWLDWTARHSRTPWTSLTLKGHWLIAEGRTAQGRTLLDRARALQPADWRQGKDDAQ